MALNLQLITRLRKNMINRLYPLADALLLRKRAIIETVNDQVVGHPTQDSKRSIAQKVSVKKRDHLEGPAPSGPSLTVDPWIK